VVSQELVINPLSQQLEPFQWVLAWHGLLSNDALAALLESSFFPKWHAVLHHWLTHQPNYDEVTRWYLGWKGLFPQDLQDQPRVRAGFNHALNMMNSAVEGQPLPVEMPQAAGGGAGGLGGAGYAAEAAAIGGAGGGVGRGYGLEAEPTFKELVERYAMDAGVEFVPKVGRYQDGLQVYSFGGISCVLEVGSCVLRAQIRDRWAPVSLERLKQEAASRKK
jgi:tuftelin-interacting protein 11